MIRRRLSEGIEDEKHGRKCDERELQVVVHAKSYSLLAAAIASPKPCFRSGPCPVVAARTPKSRSISPCTKDAISHAKRVERMLG